MTELSLLADLFFFVKIKIELTPTRACQSETMRIIILVRCTSKIIYFTISVIVLNIQKF